MGRRIVIGSLIFPLTTLGKIVNASGIATWILKNDSKVIIKEM